MSTENYASVYEEEPQSEAAFYIDEDNDNDASTSEANVKVIAGGSTHDEETEERYPKETSEPPYEEGESEDPFAVIQPTPPEEEEEAPEPSEAPPAPTLEQTPPYVTPKKSSTTVPSESSHITANNNNNTNNTNTISRGNTEEFNRPDSKRRSVSSLSPSALNSAKNTNYHSNNAEVLRRQSVLSNAQARRGSSPFSATTPNRRASRLTVAESQAMELMTYNDMKRAEVKEQSELIEMEETQIKVEKELKKEIQAYERQMTRALQQEEERHAKAIAKHEKMEAVAARRRQQEEERRRLLENKIQRKEEKAPDAYNVQYTKRKYSTPIARGEGPISASRRHTTLTSEALQQQQQQDGQQTGTPRGGSSRRGSVNNNNENNNDNTSGQGTSRRGSTMSAKKMWRSNSSIAREKQWH